MPMLGGMTDRIAAGVRQGFKALGDLAENITIERRVTGSYDATTGTPTDAVDTSIVVRGVMPMQFNQREIKEDTTIEPMDAKAMLIDVDMTIDAPLNIDDVLINEAGDRYRIMAFGTDLDPALSVVGCRVRKIS